MSLTCANCGRERVFNNKRESIQNYKKRRPNCADCQPIIRLRNNNGRPPNWKGWKINAKGYKYVWIDGRGYVLEHRYVWEQNFGPIPDGYVIHHKNGIKDDNRIENLQSLKKITHDRLNSSLRRHHWNRRTQMAEAL